jgi:hypothetical protein
MRALKLKPNQNRAHKRQTKQQQTTITKRTRLENKAAEIKMQTMRQTIYT